MRLLFRYFFRTVRILLSPVMLVGEAVISPKGLERSAEAQQQVDEACRQLTVYQFNTCPFCIKVRREMKRLSLDIEKRDAQRDPVARADLEQHGGLLQVPCLRITDEKGGQRWLYESSAIIAYLRERFGE
jgi:glutaredoxin